MPVGVCGLNGRERLLRVSECFYQLRSVSLFLGFLEMRLRVSERPHMRLWDTSSPVDAVNRLALSASTSFRINQGHVGTLSYFKVRYM